MLQQIRKLLRGLYPHGKEELRNQLQALRQTAEAGPLDLHFLCLLVCGLGWPLCRCAPVISC